MMLGEQTAKIAALEAAMDMRVEKLAEREAALLIREQAFAEREATWQRVRGAE